MFIPIHDGLALRHIPRPIATWTIMAATIGVFFLVQLDLVFAVGEEAIADLSVIPASYTDAEPRTDLLFPVPEVLTLFTYTFLHGDIMHLAGNMLFLWVFADNVEDAVGHVKFAILYFLSAAAGALAQIAAAPDASYQLIGASGSVAGLVAAYLMLHPNVKVWILALGRIPVRLSAAWVLGFWVLFQLFNVLVSTDDGVSWWTHIGGLAAGAVLLPILRRPGVPLFGREVGST